jgi:hypothetical protein
MNRQGDVSFNRGSVPCLCPQELEADAGTIDRSNRPNLSTRVLRSVPAVVCGVSERRHGPVGAVRVHDELPLVLYSAAAG